MCISEEKIIPEHQFGFRVKYTEHRTIEQVHRIIIFRIVKSLRCHITGR